MAPGNRREANNPLLLGLGQWPYEPIIPADDTETLAWIRAETERVEAIARIR